MNWEDIIDLLTQIEIGMLYTTEEPNPVAALNQYMLGLGYNLMDTGLTEKEAAAAIKTASAKIMAMNQLCKGAPTVRFDTYIEIYRQRVYKD